MGVSTLQFANLYSFYSWPNVVLPIVGGYLLDSLLGLRRGAAIFAFTLILGQSLFALGGYMDVFGLMYAGRFLFGVGGESLAVAQNTYTAARFTGSALNMVFGLQLSIARLGSTANFQVVGPLYHYFRATMEKNPALGSTLFLAGLSCVMSFVAAVVSGVVLIL
jgi:MFS family permease